MNYCLKLTYRLITKNKNLRTDLKTKHDCELKKASTLFNE